MEWKDNDRLKRRLEDNNVIEDLNFVDESSCNSVSKVLLECVTFSVCIAFFFHVISSLFFQSCRLSSCIKISISWCYVFCFFISLECVRCSLQEIVNTTSMCVSFSFKDLIMIVKIFMSEALRLFENKNWTEEGLSLYQHI